MGRRIGPQRGWLLGLLGVGLLNAVATVAGGQDPTPPALASTVPRAADRFRAAAALQNRALYDLAAAEWAALADEFPDDPVAAEARYQRGVCLFQLERYADATCEFERLLTNGPPLGPAWEEKCRAHLGLTLYNLADTPDATQRTRALEAAADALGTQLAKFPDGPLAARSLYFRCEALYALGRRPEAIDAYRQLLERFPQHPQRADALYALGVAEQEAGRLADAVETLGRFAAEFPHHELATDARSRRANALLALGQSRLRDGDPRGAEEAASRFLSDYPDHDLAGEARLLRATARQQHGDFAGGIADAVALLVGQPPQPIASNALYIRGRCEVGLGKPADAVATFERLAREDPHYRALDRVLYDLAWAYHDAGQPDRATATFLRLAEVCPQSQLAGECLYRAGEAHYAAGEFAVAAERYRAAVDRAADAAVAELAAHKLAWCHFELRQFAAAEQAFAAQCESHADGTLASDGRLMLAECRFRQGKFREACDAYAAAFELLPANVAPRPSAWVHAAQSAAHVDQWQRCFDFADRALREAAHGPWTAEAHCERGAAHFHLGQLDDAERDFHAAAGDVHPARAARARFMLGEIQRRRGKLDDAIRAYFQVAYSPAADVPESVRHWQAEALFAAAGCLEQTDRRDAAQKLYAELLARFPASARAPAARVALEAITRR